MKKNGLPISNSNFIQEVIQEKPKHKAKRPSPKTDELICFKFDERTKVYFKNDHKLQEKIQSFLERYSQFNNKEYDETHKLSEGI